MHEILQKCCKHCRIIDCNIFNPITFPRWTIFLLFFCFTISASRAQQGSRWYFGKNAGLHFAPGTTQALTDGALSTNEGSSTISNENGNLLFYSDGVTVWNRLHKPMPNGQGLKGNLSAYQSCIIVPKPGNPNFYYIFTTDAQENNGIGGYNYSEVDMTLDNGLGDISSNKNIFLNGPSSERLTAIMASNYVDYWVITNDWNSNVFKSYKVTCTGVETTPVVSSVGLVLNASNYSNIGEMKVSPDGQWLAQTNYEGSRVAVPVNEFAQLFRFDNTTGLVYAPMTISLLNDGYYIGCEFSPDSRLLYFTNRGTRTIHQYDLSSGSLPAILATKSVIPVINGSISAMQLGADQKIYLATGTSKLHVINDPNSQGIACGFQENVADLKGRISVSGLPSVVPNFYNNRAIDFTYTILDSCKGTVQFFGINRVQNSTFLWDFGDGNTSTDPNPVYTFSNPTNLKYVKLHAVTDLACGENVSGQFLLPGGAFLNAGFSFTADCTTKSVIITDSTQSSLSNILYQWDFGDGSSSTMKEPTHNYASLGNYSITQIVSSLGGCGSDSFSMPVQFGRPAVNAGNDIDVIAGSTTKLQASGATQYQWSPSTYLNNPAVSNPTVTPFADITFIVTGVDAYGCSGTDTLNVKVSKAIIAEVPGAFTPNGDGLNDKLRPLLYGIPELKYFEIYNRWGRKIYSTKTIGEGWDGTLNGQPVASDTFVWMLSVVDMNGKLIVKKGTSTLIR